MGTISKDFSYREFETSPTAERTGICNVITSFDVRDAVKELTERVLQPLRDIVRRPLRINSGYRCPELKSGGRSPDLAARQGGGGGRGRG